MLIYLIFVKTYYLVIMWALFFLLKGVKLGLDGYIKYKNLIPNISF